LNLLRAYFHRLLLLLLLLLLRLCTKDGLNPERLRLGRTEHSLVLRRGSPEEAGGLLLRLLYIKRRVDRIKSRRASKQIWSSSSRLLLRLPKRERGWVRRPESTIVCLLLLLLLLLLRLPECGRHIKKGGRLRCGLWLAEHS
jgi:hypothetical protein